MQRWCLRTVFEHVLLEVESGFIAFIVEGEGAKNLFSQESGGHRFQRVPPNEKYDRRHTSTITIAVLSPNNSVHSSIKPGDVTMTACRGSGPGGQNRNKVNSAVQLTHTPTGITIRCEVERSQHQNRELAMKWLEAKLSENIANKVSSQENSERKKQIGSGMRGDKIRTIRYMDRIVTNNLNGKKISLEKYLNGDFVGLF